MYKNEQMNKRNVNLRNNVASNPKQKMTSYYDRHPLTIDPSKKAKYTNNYKQGGSSYRPRQPSVPRSQKPIDKKVKDTQAPSQIKTDRQSINSTKTRTSTLQSTATNNSKSVTSITPRQQNQTTTKTRSISNNSINSTSNPSTTKTAATTTITNTNAITHDRPPSGRPSSLSPRPSATGTTVPNHNSTIQSNNHTLFSSSLSNQKTFCDSPPITKSPRSISSANIPKPVGLNNLGNTCFFNAAVQCLARVMPLTSFILSSEFESQINPNNPKSSKGKIAHAYKNFLQDMSKGSSYGARDPSDLRRAVVGKFKRFANFGQHDSQELLCSLLDGLHEDMNQSSYAHGREKVVQNGTSSNSEDSWSLHKSRNISPIVDIFHGVLYSSISCPECHNVEAVHDPFMFLSLDIPRRFSTVDLSDCLNSFSQRETLDAANKWKCEKCGKMVCATKEMGVDKCAKILIVHLKRFSGEGYFASKINTGVDYPDFLEASSFAKHDSGRFKLIGAVFHSGGLGGGHYTSAAVDPASGDWYNFNDSMATKIDSKSAHKGSAYMLFYQRE